ncbi:DUF2752 domain-containing protein [Arcticibacter sp. MXS-1]|uniref:DUF2752 domain-containing protein n=1 Tax=Arcticibacter sp. MXS-1 TaxID=3341726 RepID=UPI0035A8736B
MLGFRWCPGCGLGRSIACVLHGEVTRSFDYHWFGIPALAVLIHRIWLLCEKTFLSFLHKSN